MTAAADEKSYSRYNQYGENPMDPVGPIGLIPLKGSSEFTEKVNYYLILRKYYFKLYLIIATNQKQFINKA